MKNRKFIVYTHSYDDNSGGIVVLHQLCNLLNKQGQQAFLWKRRKPIFYFQHPLQSLYQFFKYYKKLLRHGYKTNPELNTPLATKADLQDAIVIYPEVIFGNPLGAKNVVRWLLHKPCFHTDGSIEFGKNDLFFYYLKVYDDSRFNKFPDNCLHIENIRRETYVQTNFDERTGSCYVIRKAKNPKIVHELPDSVLIDGLSHEEIAIIFNRVKYFISYDPYTMYSIYAVMCGCISIIIPENGVSKKEWQLEEKDRYGLAYGFDDIEYAINTRGKLLNLLEEKEINSNDSVRSFILKCEDYFNDITLP